MADFFVRGAGGFRAITGVIAALTRRSRCDFRLTHFYGRIESPVFFARNRAACHRRGTVSTKICTGAAISHLSVVKCDDVRDGYRKFNAGASRQPRFSLDVFLWSNRIADFFRSRRERVSRNNGGDRGADAPLPVRFSLDVTAGTNTMADFFRAKSGRISHARHSVNKNSRGTQDFGVSAEQMRGGVVPRCVKKSVVLSPE